MAVDLQRLVDFAVRRWARDGLLTEWENHYDLCSDSMQLRMSCPGGFRTAEISRREVAMMSSHVDGIYAWLLDIERSLREEFAALPPEVQARALEGASHIPQTDLMLDARYDGGHRFADFYTPHRDEKAEQRSKDLFRLACGEKAFQTLEKGNALPITGSLGTAYHLYAKASYCIYRVNDGAKLCAIVPGVPLWDHLLGIKLMVEHDEPKFLKTANVLPGSAMHFSVQSDPRRIPQFYA